MACVHPFHDELPGTSVAGVYLDNEADYAHVERLLNDTLDASLCCCQSRTGMSDLRIWVGVRQRRLAKKLGQGPAARQHLSHPGQGVAGQADTQP